MEEYGFNQVFADLYALGNEELDGQERNATYLRLFSFLNDLAIMAQDVKKSGIVLGDDR